MIRSVALLVSFICLSIFGAVAMPALATSIIDDTHLYERIDREGVFGGFTDNMPMDNGLWGYIATSGKLIIDPIYSQAGYFHDEQARVQRDGNFYYIDKKGKERFDSKAVFYPKPMVPDGPDTRRQISKSLLAMKNNRGSWDIFDKNKKKMASNLDNVLWFADSELAPVEVNEKWGYIDKNAKIVIQRQFEDAWPFFEGLACVSVKGKYGFISPQGKLVIQPIFPVPSRFSDGLAPMKVFLDEKKIADYYKRYREHTCYFVDKSGNKIGKLEFCAARPFSEGLAAVRTDIKWGFISTNGEYQIKPVYEGAYHFSNRRCAVKLNGRWGFIDPSGKLIVPAVYIVVGNFTDGFAPVINHDGRMKYIDLNGRVLGDSAVQQEKKKYRTEIEQEMERAQQMVPPLTDEYLWRTKLMQGKIEEDYIPISLLNPNYWYERQGAYESGLPALRKKANDSLDESLFPDFERDKSIGNKLWGYRENRQIDKFVVKPQFCWAGKFHEGIARVLINRGTWWNKPEWGFVDDKGKIVLTLHHDEVGSFYNGCALVDDHNMDASFNMTWDSIKAALKKPTGTKPQNK